MFEMHEGPGARVAQESRAESPEPTDARGILDAMLGTRAAVRRAKAEEFQLAALFADLHGALSPQDSWGRGRERLIQIGGDGTPEVAEFCLLELAARLRMSADSARLLVGDALAVRHRLPRAWAALDELRLEVWQAREIAAATSELAADAARRVDEQLASCYGAMGWARVRRFVAGLVVQADPTLARDERSRRLARRTVELGESRSGATDLFAVLDAADACFLDAQLTRVAGILADGGDADSLAVRRAKALGVLASPARALQLLQASLVGTLPDDLDTECPARGQRGHTCGTVTVDPDALLPVAEVVVHVTDETLRDGAGVARSDSVGALLMEWLASALGHTRITVRPVLDCNGIVPTDSYEVPRSMREAVQLRSPYEVFPWSTRASRHLDLDHTAPYRWGTKDDPVPPGQTRPDNLGPLGRRAHRARTHGGWQVVQPMDGIFLWRSPLGHRYLTTPSLTFALDQPQG